jgi:hypothetical protein
LNRTLDRREFTLEAALAVLSSATITISGCGGGYSSDPNPVPSAGPGDKTGSVASNHGHTAVITAAELAGAAAITISIRGQANHTHTVTYSAADVAAIAAGQRISRESTSGDAHTHTVTFN